MCRLPGGDLGIADVASPDGLACGFCGADLCRMGHDCNRPFSGRGLVGLAFVADRSFWRTKATLHFTSFRVWLCPMGAVPSQARELWVFPLKYTHFYRELICETIGYILGEM